MRVSAAAFLTLLAATGAVFAQTGAALAQTTQRQCVKPPTPACIDDLTTYVSADKMIECQDTVKIHIDAGMAYLMCPPLGDPAANAELIAAVNRFNCRLQGGENCK